MRLRYRHPPQGPEPPEIVVGPTAALPLRPLPRGLIADLDAPPATCKDRRCIWPCEHHLHGGATPDLTVPYGLLEHHSAADCENCQVLRAIVDARCCCMITGALQTPSWPHACTNVHMSYHQQQEEKWNSLINVTTPRWSCGTCDLDICLVEGGRSLPTLVANH